MNYSADQRYDIIKQLLKDPRISRLIARFMRRELALSISNAQAARWEKLLEIEQLVRSVEAEQRVLSRRFDQWLERHESRRVETAERLLVLIDFVDDLFGGLADRPGDHRLQTGLGFVVDRLLEGMEEIGLSEISAVEGQPVDRARMQIVGTTPTDDASLAGRIAAVVRRGFEGADGIYRRPQIHLYTNGQQHT